MKWRHHNQRIQSLREFCQRHCLPLLLGVTATIVVLAMWQHLLKYEQLHTHQLVQQEVTKIQAELSQELSTRILTLEQMASRWQTRGGTPKAAWEADATQYIEDFSGYQAIEWVDPSFHVRWVVPVEGNEAAQNLDLSQESRRQITLSIARDLHQTLLTRTIMLAQGGQGMLAAVPLFVKDHTLTLTIDRFDGFIVGVFRFQSLFDSILATLPQYQIQILDHNGVIYSQETPSTTEQPGIGVVQTYGVDWQIRVFPTSEFVAVGRSLLPELVLWGGLGIAWILVLTVSLRQRAIRQVQQIRRINRQLQDEMMHRQQIETSLQQLVSHINAGFVVHTPDTHIIQCNTAACELLGLSMDQMLGKMTIDSAWHFVREDGTRMPVEEFPVNLVLSTQLPLDKYVLGIDRDNQSRAWVLVTAFPEFDASQQIKHVVVTFIDISQLKQAERNLQEMATAMENAISGISRLDTQGRYLYVNKAYAEFVGYKPEEMVGMEWPQMVHSDDLKVVRNAYQQMLQDGKVEVEARGIRKDGSVVCKQLVMIATYNEQQQFVGHYCFAKDISDRKRIETERQRMENALRESESRFQMFMNHSPAPAWITDANGVMLYASQTYFHTFQLPTLEVIGKSIFELYPMDVAQHFWANIQTVVQSQEILETVEVAPHPDGTLGEFLVYKFPVPNELGPTLVGGMAIDVTRQHHAEAALRQSEATKQAIIQAIPDLLMRMHSDGSYIEFISNSHFNIINPAQVRQDVTVYDILPAHLARLRMHYAHLALKSHATQIYEQEIIIGERQRYEEVRIVPLQQDEVLVMVRDITDSKQAEKALLHQKEMFQAIVDHIPVMIALFDRNGHIEFANPELEHSLGWSLEEWQNQDILSLCYPDAVSRQSVKEFMLAATGRWQDMVPLTASGQSLETCWANVRLSNGQFLGIGQDISERKRKETALRQVMEAAEAANLAKSMFLANMSHELRTPLNVILGFAQVMSHDSALTPAQLEDLQTIQRSGDHLLSLINDVLDLSKIEAGHCTLEESGLDLISLLHTLRTMMAERATAKQLHLTFEIAPEVPQFIIADAQKLRQILLNLLSNAIKFTKQGQVKLAVSIVRHASGCMGHSQTHHPGLITHDQGLMPHNSNPITLQFEVADTGVGIAETEQESIFDAFAQAEAGRQSMGGTGLGLTISRKLLELMNGSISVKSTPGLGSTFTVTVPVCPTSGIDGQVEQQERTIIGLAPRQPHRRILVVDDQRENRRLMVRLLARLGLDVQEAANGQEAIALWQQWKPDLTWMDIRMPVLDGYEATKQIRAMEHERTSIIIALTAQASQSDRALALAAGCNDYISKPFREETLFLKLKEYLGLEYLYAEASDLSNSSPVSTLDANADLLNSFDPQMLARVPADWLETLKDLALCGNDRAIVDLANQLAPEFDNFRMQLLDLANRFEFEQIVHLIHHNSSF